MSAIQLLQNCRVKLQSLQSIIPVKTYQFRLAEIDELMSAPNAWSDNRKAATLLKERQHLTSLLSNLEKLSSEVSLLTEYIEAFPEEAEAVSEQITQLDNDLTKFELAQIMTGPHDSSPALLTISAGAGGTEAKNFVSMLARMYLRYCDRMGWSAQILDEKQSEEYADICLDNITIQVVGENAYGFLKGESGVHRLIRQSPFNSGGARHTSFAAISVMPDIEDEIKVEINESDLEIQAIRGSSPGGQHANKVSSCIRILHKPTGLIIKAQTERSQLENKRIAFKLLKARLFALEVKKKETEKSKMMELQSDIAFGHQIRTFTLNPFQLVKNHKSGFENAQAEQVLDGDLGGFLIDNLKSK